MRGLAQWHPLRALLLVVVATMLVPDSAVHPTSISLTREESAEYVDFDDGTVWILVLGSDARPGEAVTDGRSDAIQLVGMNRQTGAVAGIGIPRDSYLQLPGEGRKDRINAALAEEDGPKLTAQIVENLLGIQPDYVLVVGFDGFRGMVGAIGGVTVRSPDAFTDPEHNITVRRGRNRFDPEEALNYARSRSQLIAGDFARSANQQRLMLGALDELRAHQDEDGFIEQGALAALDGLQTNLSPTQIYRLSHAVSQIDPQQVGTCVLPGAGRTVDGVSLVFLREQQARRIGDDVGVDARFDGSCSGQ